MEVTVEQVQAAVLVAILTPHGEVDASNYTELVEKAQSVYQEGVRDVLLDLHDTSFLSSSGLVALHSISLLMRGKRTLDPAEGWDVFQAMEQNLENGVQKHVKLLSPQARVNRTLERTGLKDYFEIFTDRETALASFGIGKSPGTTRSGGLAL